MMILLVLTRQSLSSFRLTVRTLTATMQLSLKLRLLMLQLFLRHLLPQASDVGFLDDL